jgi:hypothetical protein
MKYAVASYLIPGSPLPAWFTRPEPADNAHVILEHLMYRSFVRSKTVPPSNECQRHDGPVAGETHS